MYLPDHLCSSALITLLISYGGTDKADDGIFQPDPLADFVVNVLETKEPDFTLVDHRGVISDLEEEQSMFLQSVENARIDSCNVSINPEYSSGI